MGFTEHKELNNAGAVSVLQLLQKASCNEKLSVYPSHHARTGIYCTSTGNGHNPSHHNSLTQNTFKKVYFLELLLHFSNVVYSSYANTLNTSEKAKRIPVAISTMLQEPMRLALTVLQGNSFANIQCPLTTGEVGSTLSCKWSFHD